MNKLSSDNRWPQSDRERGHMCNHSLERKRQIQRLRKTRALSFCSLYELVCQNWGNTYACRLSRFLCSCLLPLSPVESGWYHEEEVTSCHSFPQGWYCNGNAITEENRHSFVSNSHFFLPSNGLWRDIHGIFPFFQQNYISQKASKVKILFNFTYFESLRQVAGPDGERVVGNRGRGRLKISLPLATVFITLNCFGLALWSIKCPWFSTWRSFHI